MKCVWSWFIFILGLGTIVRPQDTTTIINLLNPTTLTPETLTDTPHESRALIIGPPTDVELEWKEDTMLGVRWTQPSIRPDLVSGYYVTWENTVLGDKITIAVPHTTRNIVLQKLEPLTSYYFTIRSFYRPSSDQFGSNRDWLGGIRATGDESEFLEEEIVSEATEPIVLSTDVPRPRPPVLLPLTCPSPNEILVKWTQSPEPQIDQFSIYIRPSHNKSFAQPVVHVRPSDTMSKPQEEYNILHNQSHSQADMAKSRGEGDRNHEYLIQNLTSGLKYHVGLTAGTKSTFDPDFYRHSNLSEVQIISLDQSCGGRLLPGGNAEVIGAHEVDQGDVVAWSFLEIGSFIFIGALLFGLCIFGILVYVCRRNSNLDWRILERNPASVSIEPTAAVGLLGWEPSESSSIPVRLFPAHVAGLHADGDIGFSKEYETIQGSNQPTDFTTSHSSHPDNKLKNRYLNILAYDHTLVLSEGFGQKDSPKKRASSCPDYFNGNYIDGYHKGCAYIGTQGPLPSTFETFWRVVWEHRVLVIVMITNLIERGRKKCDQYWPSEGSETYGLISVRLIREESTATFTTRTLGVRCLRSKKCRERKVYHFHYTNWPDHGTPSHNLPVLNFVRKSSGANYEEESGGGQGAEGGPIIVHCSAGVGRTGTYIVIAEMLKQAKEIGEINIVDYLNHIRKQRNFLVQTEEQYIFIHDALLEAVQSGETCMSLSHLPPYLHSLQFQRTREETGEVYTLLERQYQLVTQFQAKSFHYSQATKQINVPKNRKPQKFLPIDPYRVLLIPKAGADGSDYINATFLPGYFKLREFIITQHPLESTVVSFWQMLLDHNVNRVVVLSETTEEETEGSQGKTSRISGDDGEETEVFSPFWPYLDDDLVFDSFTVKLIQETSRVGFVLRTFALNSQSDDVELTVEMIISSSWPHHPQTPGHNPGTSNTSTTPTPPQQVPSEIFELIQMVQDLDSSSVTPSTGPIVVVDKYGGVEACTFCLLSTVCNQLDSEGTLDIYMYAKMYYEQKPVWTGLEDYLKLYLLIDGLTKGRRNSEPLLPITSSPLTLPPLHPLVTTTTTTLNNSNGINSNLEEQLVEVEYRPLENTEPSSPIHALLVHEIDEEDEEEEPHVSLPKITSTSNGGIKMNLSITNNSQQLPYESSLCISSPPSSISISEDNFRVSSICQSESEDQSEEQGVGMNESGEHAYERIWMGTGPEPGQKNSNPAPDETLIDIGDEVDDDRSSGSHVVLLVQQPMQVEHSTLIEIESSKPDSDSLPQPPTPEPDNQFTSQSVEPTNPLNGNNTTTNNSAPNSPTLSSPIFLQSPPLSPNSQFPILFTSSESNGQVHPSPLPGPELSENGKSPSPSYPLHQAFGNGISPTSKTPIPSPIQLLTLSPPPTPGNSKSPQISPSQTHVKSPQVSPAQAYVKSPQLSPTQAYSKPPQISPTLAFVKPPQISPTQAYAKSPQVSPTPGYTKSPQTSPLPTNGKASPPMFSTQGNGKLPQVSPCLGNGTSIFPDMSLVQAERAIISKDPENIPSNSPLPLDHSAIFPVSGNGTSISPTPSAGKLPSPANGPSISPAPENGTSVSPVPENGNSISQAYSEIPANGNASPTSPTPMTKSPSPPIQIKSLSLSPLPGENGNTTESSLEKSQIEVSSKTSPPMELINPEEGTQETTSAAASASPCE